MAEATSVPEHCCACQQTHAQADEKVFPPLIYLLTHGKPRSQHQSANYGHQDNPLSYLPPPRSIQAGWLTLLFVVLPIKKYERQCPEKVREHRLQHEGPPHCIVLNGRQAQEKEQHSNDQQGEESGD
jgi:hypothetical protein